jgi:hypothetical protein
VIPAELVRAGGRRIATELGAHGWLRPGSPVDELLAADGVGGGILSHGP